jgi:hypothetical protein
MPAYDPRLGRDIERDRKVAADLRKFVCATPWTHYLVLNFNWRRGRVSDVVAQRRFYSFMTEIDIFTFGNKNWRYSRTKAVATQENITSNRHLNVLMELVHPKSKRVSDTAIQNIWSKLVPGGTSYLQPFRDSGVVDYCFKQVWQLGNYERVLFSEGPEEREQPMETSWPSVTLFDKRR